MNWNKICIKCKRPLEEVFPGQTTVCYEDFVFHFQCFYYMGLMITPKQQEFIKSICERGGLSIPFDLKVWTMKEAGRWIDNAVM